MHALTTPAPRRRLFKPLVAALATASACAAWAQEGPSPWSIGAKETVGRDSNIYRIPGGPHDYYYSTTLLGGFDQQISRQRLYANANVAYNKYHNATQLDNTSYGVNAGWDWATIEKLTGNFNAAATQALSIYDGNANNPALASTKNLLRTDQLSATGRWGGEGILSLEANYAHSRVRYSSPLYLGSESNGDTASIGGYYRVGPTLRLGLAYRGTRTESPHALPLATDQSNTNRGNNADLIADWRYSPQTSVYARVSYTRQTNSNALVEDYTGTTGALTATYVPTAKLAFDFQVSRDAGPYANFFNVPQAAPGGTTGTTTGGTSTSTYGLTQGSQTSDLASIGVRYAATAKINANASYRYRHAKTVATGGTDTNDNLQTATLGVTYDITRTIQFGCNWAREHRDVGGAAAYAYFDTNLGCSAQIMLR